MALFLSFIGKGVFDDATLRVMGEALTLLTKSYTTRDDLS